jgi:hypothetical protein
MRSAIALVEHRRELVRIHGDRAVKTGAAKSAKRS